MSTRLYILSMELQGGSLAWNDSGSSPSPGRSKSPFRSHQIANTGNVDLLYLAAGCNDPDETAVYPDGGMVMICSLQQDNHVGKTGYDDGESEPPKIFELANTFPG